MIEAEGREMKGLVRGSKRVSHTRSPLLGRSQCFLEVVNLIPAVARAMTPVLILGETGTGKELFAAAVHAQSERANMPFVPINCASFAGELMENELFGHNAGAYTGAHKEAKGMVELAEGGTLFLDEVNSLPVDLQAKLLRFLQDGCFRRLGGGKLLHSDVRLVAAANVDLAAAVKAGTMRADFYYRLAVITLRVPPLRARLEDVGLLARHFLKCQDGVSRLLSPGACEKLMNYGWPGNVRELQNVVRQAAVLHDASEITAGMIALPSSSHYGLRGEYQQLKRELTESFDRRYLAALQGRHDGNTASAAREAGMDRTTLYRLFRKYGMVCQEETASEQAGPSGSRLSR